MSGKNHRGAAGLNPNADPFPVGMALPSGTVSGNNFMENNNPENFHMMNPMDVNPGYGMSPQYDGGNYNRGSRYNANYNMNSPLQQGGYHPPYGPPHPNDLPYSNTPNVGRPPMAGSHRHGGNLPMNMNLGGGGYGPTGGGGGGLNMGGLMDRPQPHHLMQGGGYNVGPPQPPQQPGMGGGGGYGGYRGNLAGHPQGGGYAPEMLRNATPSPASAPLPHHRQNQSQAGHPPLTTTNAALRVKEPPKVILVTGFRMTGKTTIAKKVAEFRDYEYVGLRGEDAEDVEVSNGTNSSRFMPLTCILERKKSIKGIVIDDALMRSKYEPYHVNYLLEKAGLHIDILVIITNELSDILKRGFSFESAAQKQAHPESFEFGEKVEEANNSDKGAPIIVLDGTESLEVLANEVIKQLVEVEARGLPSLRLPKIEFIRKSTLVTDPNLVESVLAAEIDALELKTLPYGFPYSEPNYLLGYLEFVRNALLFKSYLVVPWIWGDKVSLIGYDDKVYIHLPSYKIIFLMQEVPAALQDLLARLKEEQSQKDDKPSTAKTCLFSLEATMLDNIIYISDLMVMGKHLGSKMLLPNRIELLNESLGKLPADGTLRLLEYFPVNKISKCMEKYANVARGILFVNPDGMAAGSYESRNFIYPCEDKKTVKIRIWGGHLEENGMWCFDAYARDSEGEVRVTNADNVQIPVYIPDAQVGEFTINDGNIIECVLEQKPPSPTPKGGKKGSKSNPTSYFVFQKRCNWQVGPTTLYYQSAFVAKPMWASSSFLETCSAIPYKSVCLPAQG
ncbi:unnamed protein product [Phytomonas sp. EM1]|nr:unnamed protein product [Phytomonas sp. EM1]|eukprot:CCW62793.1 unnamed protein product [Phytomonas sp. isolate EM1]